MVAPQEAGKLLRDPKDQPILNAAILAQVDIVISGDKHFLEAGLAACRNDRCIVS